MPTSTCAACLLLRPHLSCVRRNDKIVSRAAYSITGQRILADIVAYEIKVSSTPTIESPQLTLFRQIGCSSIYHPRNAVSSALHARISCFTMRLKLSEGLASAFPSYVPDACMNCLAVGEKIGMCKDLFERRRKTEARQEGSGCQSHVSLELPLTTPSTRFIKPSPRFFFGGFPCGARTPVGHAILQDPSIIHKPFAELPGVLLSGSTDGPAKVHHWPAALLLRGPLESPRGHSLAGEIICCHSMANPQAASISHAPSAI